MTLAIDLADDSYTIPVPLDNGHTYEWDVRTTGIDQAMEFTVSLPGGGEQTLAAPTPTGPSGVVNTATPTFQWSAVPGADDYGFFLNWPVTSYSSPILVQGTSITLSIYPAISYTWSVVAYDGAGNFSPRSIVSDFYPDLPASDSFPAPTDLSPGGTVSSDRPTLSWSSVSGVSYYSLIMFDETAGTEIESYDPYPYQPVDTPSFTYPALTAGHTYRWYVYGYYYDSSNPQGSLIGAAATQAFTVSIPSPDVPAPSRPRTMPRSTRRLLSSRGRRC